MTHLPPTAPTRDTLTRLLPAALVVTGSVLAMHTTPPLNALLSTPLTALLAAGAFAALTGTRTPLSAALLGGTLTGLSLLTSLDLLSDPLSVALSAGVILSAAMLLRAHPARELTPLILITAGLLISGSGADHVTTITGAALTFTGSLLAQDWPASGGALRFMPLAGLLTGLLSGPVLLNLLWQDSSRPVSSPLGWTLALLLSATLLWRARPTRPAAHPGVPT